MFLTAVTTILVRRTMVSSSLIFVHHVLTVITERMMNGLEHIRNMIGDEDSSKISDADITDALYHYFFDVEQATAWLLGASALLF